jgi:hypothetical protein
MQIAMLSAHLVCLTIQLVPAPVQT